MLSNLYLISASLNTNNLQEHALEDENSLPRPRKPNLNLGLV